MLSTEQFNEILRNINLDIFEQKFDKVPSLFKINPNPCYSDKRMFELTSMDFGTIAFRTVVGPWESALEVGIEYCHADSFVPKNNKIFQKYVKMFRDKK
jgi:hypothetical protein